MNNCKSTVTIPLRRYEEMKSALDTLKQGKKIVVIDENLFLGVSQFTYVEEDSVINKFNERIKELRKRLKEAEELINAKTKAWREEANMRVRRDIMIHRLENIIKEQKSMLRDMTISEFRKYRKSLRNEII